MDVLVKMSEPIEMPLQELYHIFILYVGTPQRIGGSQQVRELTQPMTPLRLLNIW